MPPPPVAVVVVAAVLLITRTCDRATAPAFGASIPPPLPAVLPFSSVRFAKATPLVVVIVATLPWPAALTIVLLIVANVEGTLPVSTTLY